MIFLNWKKQFKFLMICKKFKMKFLAIILKFKLKKPEKQKKNKI